MTGAPSVATVGNRNRRRISWHGGPTTPEVRSPQEIRMRPGRRSAPTTNSRATAEPSGHLTEHDSLPGGGAGHFVPVELEPALFRKIRGADGHWDRPGQRVGTLGSPKLRHVDRRNAGDALDGFIDLADVQDILKPAVLEAQEILNRRLGGLLHLRP